MDTNKFLFGSAIGAIITALSGAAVVACGVTTIPGWAVILFISAVAGVATDVGSKYP